jgi:uncharacterized protein
MGKINIALAGSTGLIGKALNKHFKNTTFVIIPVYRRDFENGADAVFEKIKYCQVVVNLAGSPVIQRWTKRNRQVILNSRVETTRLIVVAMAKMAQRPRLFINASAVGIYDEVHQHTEGSKQFDNGFLGEVVKKWEDAAQQGSLFVGRLVLLRLGVVLSLKGGAVGKVKNLFRFGLGGYLGSGKQKMAYIHVDDISRMIEFIINNEKVEGIVNAVSPVITTNREYSRALALLFGWKHLFYIPGIVIKILFGKASAVLLKGQHVIPEKLIKSGFNFANQNIHDAVNSLKNE